MSGRNNSKFKIEVADGQEKLLYDVKKSMQFDQGFHCLLVTLIF